MKRSIITAILISTAILIHTGCMSHWVTKQSNHNLCYEGFYGEVPGSGVQILNSSVTKLVKRHFLSSRHITDERWLKTGSWSATFELVVPDEWIDTHMNHLELIPKDLKFQDEIERCRSFPSWYGPKNSADYQVFSTKLHNTSTFRVCELLIDKSTLDKEYKHIFIHYDHWPL